MPDYKETKEAYLKTPEGDIDERANILKKLFDLAMTSDEIKEAWKILGELSDYVAKCAERRNQTLKT
ncbi:MAG: hypothetical protein WC428_07715 [Candidatus Paceibacterota bacterium]|jgi:hypothetical protein